MNYNLIYSIIVSIVLIYLLCKVHKLEKQREKFTAISDEAVANISSLYNTGTLTVSKLVVLDQANIGNWRIKNDVIGITDRADMHLAPDKWLRLIDYDKNDTGVYAGVYNSSGGFAGANLWCGNGTQSCLNSNISGNINTNTLLCNGKLTVNGGSVFSGGRHMFQDEENAGLLRVGAAWGVPGIYSDTGKLQIQNFECGTNVADPINLGDMRNNKNYDYLKTHNDSYALLNKNNSGLFGVGWNNNRLYNAFLEQNKRIWNSDFGNTIG